MKRITARKQMKYIEKSFCNLTDPGRNQQVPNTFSDSYGAVVSWAKNLPFTKTSLSLLSLAFNVLLSV